jgi:alkylation response protein AidB-like acyl-CoA dehydrogenase
MNFENARGWLVGEPHKGMRAMFTMMNGARLGVGMQGLGLAEVRYQNAVAYAKERLQGARARPRAPDATPTRSSCIPTCAAC